MSIQVHESADQKFMHAELNNLYHLVQNQTRYDRTIKKNFFVNSHVQTVSLGDVLVLDAKLKVVIGIGEK